MKIIRFIRFYKYLYKFYKDIKDIKLFEAFEWYERLFHARDVIKWKEKGVTFEEAWWGRLFGVTPETWEPLAGKKIKIALAFPIAPDGIENQYLGRKRTNDKYVPCEDIPVFDIDVDIPMVEIDIKKEK
jgi:hypothetical protein